MDFSNILRKQKKKKSFPKFPIENIADWVELVGNPRGVSRQTICPHCKGRGYRSYATPMQDLGRYTELFVAAVSSRTRINDGSDPLGALGTLFRAGVKPRVAWIPGLGNSCKVR